MASQIPQQQTGRRVPTSSQPAIMIGQFKRLEDIGRGSFATVYRGVHMKKRSLVAIKSVQLYKLNNKLKANLFSEIKILRSLHHPHIVALIDCQETSQHVHLVMEFCQLGDLSAFIKKRNSLGNHPATADMIRKYPNPPAGGLNEVVVRHFLQQTACALEFLRARNYVHRDIKPQNLLLNPSSFFFAKHKPEFMPLAPTENSLAPAAGIESLPMLKIADFGFARVLPQTSLADTLCGSPLYMAPEILRYERYDAKADLWSVGTVLYEMMVGRPPFRAHHHVELLRKIERQDDKIKFPEDVDVSEGMKRIIRALLKKQPTERISFEAFFDHAVVKDQIPGLVEDDIPVESDVPDDSFTPAGKQPLAERSLLNRSERTRDTSQLISRSPQDGVSLSATPPSRTQFPAPASTSTALSSTPPSRHHQMARILSGSPRSGAGLQPLSPVRPELRGAITAPSRQDLHQDYGSSAVAMATQRRRSSANNPPPGTSFLREKNERDKALQRTDERLAKEARERAAQDVAFERDYVVVEKRAVEVNAFADELAANPHVDDARSSPPQRAPMPRRATTSGAQPAPLHDSPSRAMQIVPGRQRPEVSHQRTTSHERRYGPNPGSATSAISKALNLASLRLFGMGISPPLGKGYSPPQAYGAFPAYPTTQGSLVLASDGPKALASLDEDTKAVMMVEELATRSDVIYGLAQVKYKQLTPATPSNDQGLGIGIDKPSEHDDSDLTVEAIVVISEEALVLFVKALSTLAKAIDLAGSWWGHKNRMEEKSAAAVSVAYSMAVTVSGDPQSAGSAVVRSQSPKARPIASAAVGLRMNSVVQWARGRFNECLEKSECVGRKLVEAKRQLPADHPGNPANHPSMSAGSYSATSIATSSAENINLTSGVTAEKLMYERAVEMSRAAAVNELVGVDLYGCEIAYTTAIRMLEAVLENDDEPPSTAARKRFSSGGSGSGSGSGNAATLTAEVRKERQSESETINGLETEDRQTVVNLVKGTKARLKILRRTIELQKASRWPTNTAMNILPHAKPPSSPTPATSTPPKGV